MIVRFLFDICINFFEYTERARICFKMLSYTEKEMYS